MLEGVVSFCFFGSFVDGFHACGLIFILLVGTVIKIDSSEFCFELCKYSLIGDFHVFIVILNFLEEGRGGHHSLKFKLVN